MEQDQARLWAKAGQDDPPLLWDLKYWPAAAAETEFLTPQQYWHEAEQLREAARCEDPCTCETLDIRKFGDGIWELRDKGGCLGKINLRVYFHLDTAHRAIVVLGVLKKEDECQLRQSVVVRIERRL